MFEGIYFAEPIYLWLLGLIPLGGVFYAIYRKSLQAYLQVSTVAHANRNTTLKARLRPALVGLRFFVWIFVILALARPQSMDVSTRTKTNRGIDIVMAIDVSSSMLAQDLKPNRLTALKKVAANFVGNRLSDRIGLVVYAGESYTKTPITSDKGIVKRALKEIKYQGNLIEDGTAIGMGLATSVNRLKESKAQSKVIILLTDGVNNAGFIDPKTAAELAVEFGIKTYTIGLGSNGNALAPVALKPNGKFQYGLTKVEIDEMLLKEIADQTGGLYFRATNTAKLQAIYDEIDKLEKTEIEEFKYYNYDEKFRPLIWIALGLLLLEWLLRNTYFRSFI
ncbi:MAG: vWA domain-containing protein [Flavobacteriaceae bacterium]